MRPARDLPYNGDFASSEDYVDHLLEFARTSDMFRILSGGVHILDFFTSDPGLFQAAIPEDWRHFLLSLPIMQVVDLLVRDDLEHLQLDGRPPLPTSLLEYIRTVRTLSMDRSFAHPPEPKRAELPQTTVLGMKPKKMHEVTQFSAFVDRLSEDVTRREGEPISHYVDFGSGQNYLGRVLANQPYNKRVVAVEGRENNVAAAKDLDISCGLAVKPKVMRNKKLWDKIQEVRGQLDKDDPDALRRAILEVAGDGTFDFRPTREMGVRYTVAQGRGHMQYVSGRLDSGDLTDVVAKIDVDKRGGPAAAAEEGEAGREGGLRLMAVSIHSCGNLSHHGIRSLVLNPDVRAVAIVGCCYNLMTEKLGPLRNRDCRLRPTLRAANARVSRESSRCDPHGYPMSERFSTHGGDGVRLNITARMMACQALANWTQANSDGFFKRHYFRAVLQRIFLDRGVVSRVRHEEEDEEKEMMEGEGQAKESAQERESCFNTSTRPIIIGSLRKSDNVTLTTYVRGAVDKLTTRGDEKRYATVIRAKMGDMTDEEIERYAAEFGPRKKELSIMWTLMAFSATVVEGLITADRWTYLKEHADVVEDAWVETVFDYELSPRNLVVVGLKRRKEKVVKKKKKREEWEDS